MSDGAGEGCRLCPRQCGAKRTPEAGGGFCSMGTDPVIGRAALHRWEEPCISGPRGSGAVFFAGCTLLCRFCQNYELSRGRAGRRVSVRHLSESFRRLEGEGAHNLNLVTATPFIPAVLSALELYRPKIPVVFNCGGYERPETLRRLSGAVDVYLPDFKYWSGRMAALLSGAGDYPERAKEAIREMVRQTGAPVYDAEGLMQRGTLVRHLVLPGLTADAMRILTWIADEVPGTPVSLMGQYVPFGEAASIPGMNRRLTAREYGRVLAHMEACGLNGYRQLPAAADEAFIPACDGEGVE